MLTGAAVVMGVSSCGKTEVGQAIARILGADFIEGDALHPKENVARMSAGIALTDTERWPWLALIGTALKGSTGKIASCSALKRSYREAIAAKAERPVSFVFLDGDRALLERRIAARVNHFMPPSLLDSQLATLEPPGSDERARRFDIAGSIESIAEEAAAWLAGQQG